MFLMYLLFFSPVNLEQVIHFVKIGRCLSWARLKGIFHAFAFSAFRQCTKYLHVFMFVCTVYVVDVELTKLKPVWRVKVFKRSAIQ